VIQVEIGDWERMVKNDYEKDYGDRLWGVRARVTPGLVEHEHLLRCEQERIHSYALCIPTWPLVETGRDQLQLVVCFILCLKKTVTMVTAISNT
jgi:hypothetical protein